MKREADPIRVLDMGSGEGGRYISSQGEGVNYVLVDWRLNRDIARKYPNALWVVANAQVLPFPDGAFNKLETRFPHGTLLCPGLERITGVDKSSEEAGTDLSKKREALTSYSEFARVLQDGGTLTIWADAPWINTEQVIIDSASRFEVVSIEEEVTRKELEEMGSFGCRMWIQKMERQSQEKSDKVKKIILRKRQL